MTYITDTKEFLELRELISPIIDWKYKIPEGAAVKYFDWIEFRVEGFYPFVCKLAEMAGDQEFFLYDLDINNDLLSLYYERFQQYPIVLYDRFDTEDTYYKKMNEPYLVKNFFFKKQNRYEDATFCVADTCSYAIFPRSLKWHIYGEYDIELGRLVSHVGIPDPQQTPFPHDYWSENEAKRLIALKDQ